MTTMISDPGLLDATTDASQLSPQAQDPLGDSLSDPLAGTDDAVQLDARADLSALAYTAGADPSFAVGKYNPASAADKSLAAHEAAHAAQQH